MQNDTAGRSRTTAGGTGPTSAGAGAGVGGPTTTQKAEMGAERLGGKGGAGTGERQRLCARG